MARFGFGDSPPQSPASGTVNSSTDATAGSASPWAAPTNSTSSIAAPDNVFIPFSSNTPITNSMAPASVECQGTKTVPFKAFVAIEPSTATNQHNAFQNLCFQSEYKDFPPEELRFVDHKEGRRFCKPLDLGPGSSANTFFNGTSLFSSTVAGSGTTLPSSSTNAAANPTRNPFQPYKPSTGGMFGGHAAASDRPPSNGNTASTGGFSGSAAIPDPTRSKFTGFGSFSGASIAFGAPAAASLFSGTTASTSRGSFGFGTSSSTTIVFPLVATPGAAPSTGGLFPGRSLFSNSHISDTPRVQTNSSESNHTPGTLAAIETNQMPVMPGNNGPLSNPVAWNEMFTEAWDLKINAMYQGTKVIGKVSATALSLASPVWKSLLYPNLEASGTEDEERRTPKPTLSNPPVPELDLTADDGDALLVLLNLVHYKLGRVPTTPLSYIDKIAALCHKYECFALVGGPWLHLWMHQATTTLNSSTASAEMLFTTWTFGMKQHFENIGAYLIKNMRVDDQGRALTSDGFPFPCSVLPDVVARIISIRTSTIEGVLQVLYDRIGEYAKSKENFCQNTIEACHALTFGSLIRNAEKNGLWPTRKACNIWISIDSLVKQIEGFIIEKYHQEENTCPCAENLMSFKINGILQAIPSLVEDAGTMHMEEQRKKLENRL